VLTRQDILFAPDGVGSPADSRADIGDRASRGSGLLAGAATWVYAGQVTAHGTQDDRGVWADYYPGVEQPTLGPLGGMVSHDWVVFVATDTENVVLSITVAGEDETLGDQYTGMVGSLRASGGRFGSDGQAVDGQIMVWASEEQPSTTTSVGVFARPTAAVSTSTGAFQVELKPGWYIVRATATGGQVCGEQAVEVQANHTTFIDFTCDRR